MRTVRACNIRYGQTCTGRQFVFFFSSRRRHTRCSRDWSSDVCSSDLPGVRPQAVPSIRTPRLSLLIDVTGRVLQTRLLEGSTDSDVDRAFEQSLRGRRFRPALIDGQGVTAWTEWPLRASSAH